MDALNDQRIQLLLYEIEKLHNKKELYDKITPDYFEPGNMENLDKYEGYCDNNKIIMSFEVRGTRYDNRSEYIEELKVGDEIRIIRDSENEYNHNNFTLESVRGKNVGNVPAELCNVLAPLYDDGIMIINSARVSFVEHLLERVRYAKQAVLFIRLEAYIDI